MEGRKGSGGKEGAGGSRARGGNSPAGWCAASRDRLSWEFPRREGEGERRSPPPAGRGRSFALRSPASFPPSLPPSLSARPPGAPLPSPPHTLTHTHRHTEARAGGAHHPAAGRCRSRPARFPAGARGEPGDVTGGALAPRSPPRNFWFWEVVPGIAPADPPAAPGAPARPPSLPPSRRRRGGLRLPGLRLSPVQHQPLRHCQGDGDEPSPKRGREMTCLKIRA